QCANNLHQIALGLHNYESTLGKFPRYRRCDTSGGVDVDCYALTSATIWTGPGEVWWAPYDNRPAPSTTTNAQGSPNPDNTYANGGYPAGLLWQYVEGNQKIFKCPNGIDPVTGKPYQCSYGMNYVNGGPNGKSLGQLTNGNGSSNILIVWDHGKTPGCADSTHASTWAVALPGHDQPEDALPGPAAHKHVQRPVLRRAHHGDAASRAVRGRHFTISCRRLRANVPMTYAGARRGVSPKCLANGHASA